MNVRPNVDDIQLYVALKIELHPCIQATYDICLMNLQYHGKITLLPATILAIYNNKFNQSDRTQIDEISNS